MLESLPFPKSRPGVLAAVALTIFFFILYYGIGFSLLLKIYDNQFQNVPFVEGSCDGLDTHVRIPKWVYSNGVQWVYVSIENHSGVEMKNITVQFCATREFP
ncbi:hypothetical protein [Candidatus Villigracilis affinis]|uniref:hypothetical protein n=1 Tax=Candidatus Villigracilis affinis TaxID=3140682 RepID=UPI002A1B9DDF|nr:hypothetical protein [Anaerolineales bacterium]